MQLFLASALSSMKDQLIKKVGVLEGKKIAYIINPADNDVTKQPEGENVWRGKNDRDMLEGCGAILQNVDLRVTQHDVLTKLLENLDGIYLSGGNTYYFRQLALESGYDTMLNNLLIDQNKLYMSTSAGSCAMGSKLKYLEPGREDYKLFDGFGYVPSMILPHRGSKDFTEDYAYVLEYIYKEKQSIITLTDQQALRVTEQGIEIVTAQ